MFLLLLGVAWGAGCTGECQSLRPWANVEVQVEDPSDPVQAEAGEHAREALGQFAAWNGLEALCIADVTVVADDSAAGETGAYNYRTGDVTIRAYTTVPWGTTFHELCHAVEFTLDLAMNNPEWFPDEEIEEGYYHGSEARTREAFARVCDDGARDVDRWRTWQDECSVDYVTDLHLGATEIVQDGVFDLAPRFPWSEPSFEATVGEPWSLPEPEAGWRAIRVEAAPDQVVVVHEHDVDRFVLVKHLVPDDGSEVGRDLFDPCPDAEKACAFATIPGDEGVWLRAWDEDERWLWRLSASGAEAVEDPCLEHNIERIAGGVAWDLVSRPDEPAEIVGCDLASGEVVHPPVLASPFPADTSHVWGVWHDLLASADRPAIWWQDYGLAWLDQDGQTWHPVALPWHLAIHQAAPLPDGTWLLLLKGVSGVTSEEVVSLTRIDPRSGTLSVPYDPCALSFVDEGGIARVLHAGDGWAVLSETAYLEGDETRLHPIRIP